MKDENPCGDGTNVSEAASPEVSADLMKLAVVMAGRAMVNMGELKLDGAALDIFRDASSRTNWFAEPITYLAPDVPYSESWIDWLRKG